MKKDMSKIFGIGFQKTGTKSLGAALEKLSYCVCGPVSAKDPDIAKNAPALIHSLVPRYDAFQDNPWPLFYEDLDRRYPGSRFILTVRSPETWIESVVAHFGDHDTPMRRYIYGVGHPEGNEWVFLERYRRHNDEVRHYFRNRSEDYVDYEHHTGRRLGAALRLPRSESSRCRIPQTERQGQLARPGLVTDRRGTVSL